MKAHSAASQSEQLAAARLKRVTFRINAHKRELRERLAESKRIFGQSVLAVDLHSHSNHSDGSGTLAQNRAAAAWAGLDFFFATDHKSLQQKRQIRDWPEVSWGQEPGAGSHHLGLLRNRRLFRPRAQCFAEDYRRARALADFVWIPHPVGWYPAKWYSEQQIEQLWTIGEAFALEVLNGANKMIRAFDAFDSKAVEVWDRLLLDGKHVTALGGSDAHCPEDFGSAWTGVFTSDCSATGIIDALNCGHCFASESSLLNIACNGHGMGSSVQLPAGAPVELTFRVADAAGINSVRLVANGEIVLEEHGCGKSLLAGQWQGQAKQGGAYYRLETTACDDRRAFSTPIYVL